MRYQRSWRRRPSRGVSQIIATILMVAMTLVAGVLLWTFKINTPSASPNVTFSIRSGTSTPVWGDPTDCMPWFPPWLAYNTWTNASTDNRADYTAAGTVAKTVSSGYFVVSEGGGKYGNNFTAWYWGGLANVTGGVKGSSLYTSECQGSPPTGDFSPMNSTQFIVATHAPDQIALSDIELIFICNNTVFLNGSLSAMTWFPGSSSGPAPNAPHLGTCGSFIPSGSYSTLYNRFGIFVPLSINQTQVLANGDTFIMYIHTSSPFDPNLSNGNGGCGPAPDCDDFHGAPAWCFTNPGACTLSFVYTGTPQTLLASISLYNIIRG